MSKGYSSYYDGLHYGPSIIFTIHHWLLIDGEDNINDYYQLLIDAVLEVGHM